MAKQNVPKGPQTGRISFINPRGGILILRTYSNPDGSEHKIMDRSMKKEGTYGLDRTTTFNLNNAYEKMIYEGFFNHPTYKRMLSFESVEAKAEQKLTMRELRREAELAIENLGLRLRPFARLVGLNVSGQSIIVVKNLLLEQTDNEKSLQNLTLLLNDPKLEHKLIYNSGKHYQIIANNNGVASYEGRILGQTIDSALNWFDDNPDFLEAIRVKVKERAEAEEVSLIG